MELKVILGFFRHMKAYVVLLTFPHIIKRPARWYRFIDIGQKKIRVLPRGRGKINGFKGLHISWSSVVARRCTHTFSLTDQ